MFKKYIGTKQFYAMVWAVFSPIVVQNIITNFVNLLDNLMVGQVATEPMSGVAIVSQLVFVFNLGVYGACSGMSIMTTQFFGSKDEEGIRNTFRMKVLFCVVYMVAAWLILKNFGDDLIWKYLHEGEEGFDLVLTAQYAHDYLEVIIKGLPFFLISQVFGSTLRDMRETKVPMIAGLVAVGVNLVFNYLLIFGMFGFPELGIVGAAIATNISRIVEAAYIVIWCLLNKDKAVFMSKFFERRIPAKLFKKLLFLSVPSFFNEILWSFGQTMINQSMSIRGIEVVPAINICSAIIVVCKSFFLSMGMAIAIIVGNQLGAGETEEAIDTDRKMMFMSEVITIVIAAIVLALAKFIPMLYNTTDSVRALATKFIIVQGAIMPMMALVNASYHTIKSGGRPLITFLFDSGYTWLISVPCAFILSRYTSVPTVPMYAIIYGIEFIKLVVGLILVKKKIWVRTLVKKESVEITYK